MLKSKKLLASSLTILLSSTSSYAVDPAPVRARSVKVPAATGPIATFSNGVGLDRGNIPITAVKMGYFIIPNGATLNPALANNTPVTFQKVGANWTAYMNNAALAGSGYPAYFSQDALNHAGRNSMRIVNGQVQWEDLDNGDNDYDDAVLTVSVPHTEINDVSQLVLGSGAYPVPLIIKYKVQQTGVSSNAGYNNSIGHYFIDAAGNPLSGYVDFANIKNNIGSVSNQPYSGNDQFGTGSTLQYEARATAVADIAGTNIAAADVSTIPVGNGDVILRIDQSAKLGSVVNSANRTDNQLSVQITNDKILTLTGTGGILFNGKGAAVNNYDGLKEIKGLTAGNATVEFANPGFEISLNAPVGIDGKLKTLRLLNNSVVLKKDLSTTAIEFTNSNQISALKLTGGVVDLGATNVTTSSTTRNHNIWISSDQNITGNIATANNPLGTIKFLADKRIKVNTSNFYTDVYTQTTNTGTVEFIKNGAMSYSLGEPDIYLLLTKFTESAQVRGSAYSKNISVASAKTASFVKRTTKTGTNTITPYVRTPGGFVLEGVGSTAYFGDQAEIYNPIANNNNSSGNITTNIANEGIVQFEGSAQVRMHIGTLAKPLKQVDWLANNLSKTIILARNVHAKNINMSKATYIIESDQGTFNGNTSAVSPTINFGQHIQTFTGGQTTFTGTPVFNVYFDNKSNSHLTVSGTGSNVNFANASTLTFNITDNSTLPPARGRVYYFFRIENGATLTQIDPLRVVVNQVLNPFMKWDYSYGNLTQTRDIANGLRTIIVSAGGNPNNIPAALLSVDPDGDSSASKYLQDLSVLVTTDPGAAGESLRRVIQATNPTGQVAITTTQSALGSIVAARINNTQLFQFRLTEESGVAAGSDIEEQRGVWASPFINQSTQKSIGEDPGYKSRAYGGSAGFDNRFSDNLILGIAGTFLNTSINYKDFKIGDKTKIDTFLGSIYGLYNLQKNWFVQGVLSAAWNKVKNIKPRISLTSEQADSRYNSQTYGLEATLGYDYKHCQWLNVMPLGGFRYGRFNGDRYTEKNTLNQNLTISKKKIDKIEAILGLKLATIKQMQGFTVIPEIHGFINYDLGHKAPKIYTQLDGMDPMPAKISKPARAQYNLGLGVKTWHNIMEYEATYDSYLSKKYVAHQGTLKVKLNF